MFLKVKSRYYHIILSILLLLAAAACEETPLQPDGKSRPRVVPVVQAVSTKADGPDTRERRPGSLLSERVVCSSDGFDLIEMVYENSPLPFRSDASTKGSVVTTENISAFDMMVYAESSWYDNTISGSGQGTSGNPYPAGLYFEASCNRSGSSWGLTKTSGPAKPGDSGELYWLNDVPMTFWSWKYVKPSTDASDAGKASFSYTVKSDVGQQEDLVYAFSRENRKYHDSGSDYGTIQSQSSTSGASGDKVNIWFYHALSAVQFLQNTSLTDYRISSIEIRDVNSHTECVMAGSSSAAAAGSPNITFDHTPSTIASFSQNYSTADIAAGGSLAEPSGASASGTFKPGDAKTFLMVPQSLGNVTDADAPDAALKVTFVYTGTGASGSETTSPVFELNGTWDAGKYYVYKVDLKGNIHVSISELCPADVKSDVKFRNTCNVNEYIRAAVIGNWYDAAGNIVAAWDRTRDGDITPGSGWTQNGGFYYHSQPVASGSYTGALIGSFTQPSNAPVAGAHFEMTILVQAVASDGISSCTAAF